MGLITWEDQLPEIAESFGGQLPYPETADDIAAAYQRAPQTVLRMADQVAALYVDGTAQNPWGMLRYRVKQIPEHDATKPTGTGRDKAIERAEQRIRNELLHYDRLDEALDELFGERGTLREHHTPELEARMAKLWNDLRPAGQLVEAEAEERGRRYVQQRDALKAKTLAQKLSAEGNLEIKDGIAIEKTIGQTSTPLASIAKGDT